MMPIPSINYGYQNRVSKQELKMDEKVFKEALKQAKKSEIRDADWGSYAAQNCLARDLVNADPEEVGLIMEKMRFLQDLMNGNLELDSDLYDKKIDSNVKRNGSRCEVIKTTSDAVGDLVEHASDIVDKNGIICAGKILDCAA